MPASKTPSTTSYSRAGSPSVDELLADLKESVAVPPTYHDDTVYHPQTPSVLPTPSASNIDPEWAYKFNTAAPSITDSEDPVRAIKRPLPAIKFTTLGKDMGHPQGFDFSAFGQASRSPCIQWDSDLVFVSHRPSGAVDRRFVVDSGTAFGVEGYEDICGIVQKRKAEEDVDIVAETKKKQRAQKPLSRRSPRKITTSSSPAKRAAPKPAPRKSTPAPAPASRQPTPRPQTSQKSATAGPSATIPVRQTRWTTQAEKSIMMEA